MNKKKEVLWVRFDFLLLIADRWWRTADPASRGLYWSIITDLYAEGGRLVWDVDEIARACNCPDVAGVERLLALKFYAEVDPDTGQRWLRHKKVDQELDYAHRFYERQAENGRKGGRPRKQPENEDSATETSGLSPLNPWVLENKPSGFFLKTTDRPTEPTEQTDRQTDRPTDSDAAAGPVGNGTGAVRLVRFVEAVQKELRARTTSDATTIKHAGQFLLNVEQQTGQTNLLYEAIQVSKTCRTARKPIAVWCTRIKDEFGWNPVGRA
jgi:hypothetical protein